ncbi:MAG: dihydroneopterin aldolase [Bacteroidaceae bacterium]|nr:dihydroneopterin aldolase [Bacteroidaceae bacterium]
MSHKIILQQLRLYAHHGVMEQERKIGAYFTIDAEVETDFSAAIDHDELSGTINYADLFAIIRHEMATPSRLLEHVAGRIAQSILRQCPTAQSVRIKILKENPPMGADCQGAGVELTMTKP